MNLIYDVFFTRSSADVELLTNPRIRDAFSGQSRSPTKLAYGTIRYVRYCFLLVCYRNFVPFEIFDL